MTGTKKNWISVACSLLLGLCSVASAVAADAEDEKLPVPRFVSLKSSEVNMRVGPGTRYSINWVYRRENYPVEIIQEFDQWREIRDVEGTKGWVHKNMLQGKRFVIIRAGTQVLRQKPDPKARPLLRLEAGVVARLLECEEQWCRVQIESTKGWLEKKKFWGAYSKEMFD